MEEMKDLAPWESPDDDVGVPVPLVSPPENDDTDEIFGGFNNNVELCEEQEEAVQRILDMSDDEVSIILTGCAGSGKSTVVRYLLSTYPDDFTVCATTGKAAVLVGGQTVDSLFCFDRKFWTVRSLGKQSQKLMNAPEYIIIDEASMIGNNMAHIIHEAAISFKKKIVLVGDWAQASPVKDMWPFRAPLFKDAADVLRLRVNHRQDEGDFFTALNWVRLGICDENISNYFLPRLVPGFDDDNVVYVTGLRNEARYRNNKKLEDFVKEEGVFPVSFTIRLADKRPNKIRDKYPLDEFRKKNLLESANLAHDIKLAVGCRVIITRNSDLYVNGDTGTLESMTIWDQSGENEVDNYTGAVTSDTAILVEEDIVTSLKVKLDRTGEVVPVNKITVESVKEGDASKDNKKVDFEMTGFPIDLGYAITIHKSQGMTIPKICVDIASVDRFPKESKHGLAYVALSRVKDIEDLILINWSETAVYSDELVRPMITGEN